MKKRYTEEQIIHILKQAESGLGRRSTIFLSIPSDPAVASFFQATGFAGFAGQTKRRPMRDVF